MAYLHANMYNKSDGDDLGLFAVLKKGVILK